MKQTKEILKTYFEAGDKPTQTEFEDLIDSFAHVDVVAAQRYPTYKSFKQINTGTPIVGFYCIKIPYVGTNFSMTLKIYRHGNGIETYIVSGYLNEPNGWVQIFVDKVTQNTTGLPLEIITLTNASDATDFRIYIGDGTKNRAGSDKIFITEAYITGISNSNPEVNSMDDFTISIESTITGVVKGTF